MLDLNENIFIFKDFNQYRFEDWLRIGLEGYVLNDKKFELFSGLAIDINRYDYPAEALDAVYQNLSPEQQSSMRLAVASLISSWEINKDNFLVWEQLLQLASLLPVPEVLRSLPSWLRLNYLHNLSEKLSRNLFNKIILTVIRLVVPTPESVQCLRELVALDKFFRAEWSGLVLEALWFCDNINNITEHFERLRPYLSKLMIGDASRPEIWARRILNTVGLYKVVQTLPSIKYYGQSNDAWILRGLLSGDCCPVECWVDQGKLYFRLNGQEDTQESISIMDEFDDLFSYLRLNRLIKIKPKDSISNNILNQLNSVGIEKSSYVEMWFQGP